MHNTKLLTLLALCVDAVKRTLQNCDARHSHGQICGDGVGT